jgi:pyridoxine 5'-phosphate synthase PdxJ
MPTEEDIRQLATSAGSRASRAKTAEALGERDGGAYADAITDEAKERSRKAARHAASQASRAAQQRFMTVAAGFALGYAAALLINRRQ